VRELYRYLRRQGINLGLMKNIGRQDWQIEIPKTLATSNAIIISILSLSVPKYILDKKILNANTNFSDP
jgi:hypothetical protein